MVKDAIAIASDHAGFDLKCLLKDALARHAETIVDLGVNNTDPSDYPDLGYAMAYALRRRQARFGVLICGSGIGISIAANRYPDIRAALVHDALGARLAREHNDANVICFGGRMIGPEVARDCLDVFLHSEFTGGRHAQRILKLSNPI